MSNRSDPRMPIDQYNLSMRQHNANNRPYVNNDGQSHHTQQLYYRNHNPGYVQQTFPFHLQYSPSYESPPQHHHHPHRPQHHQQYSQYHPEVEQITEAAFNSIIPYSPNSVPPPMQWSHSPIPSPRQSQTLTHNSMQSYRSINARVQIPLITPIGPTTHRNQHMTDRDQSYSTASPFNLSQLASGSSSSRSIRQPDIIIPPFEHSNIGFDEKTHNRWIIYENENLAYMSSLKEELKEDPAIEDAKLFQTKTKFVLFALLIDARSVNPGSGHYRRYTSCPEFFVRHPSEVYIKAIMKGKSKEKLKFHPKHVNKLFETFGNHRIRVDNDYYVLSVDENALVGIKRKFGSTVQNGRLILDIDLESELSAEVELGLSSSSSEREGEKDFEVEKPHTPFERHSRPQSKLANIFRPKLTLRSKSKTRATEKFANSQKIHHLDSDEEDNGSTIFKNHEAFKKKTTTKISELLSKTSREKMTSAELRKAISDEEKDDDIINDDKAELGDADDDLIMSHQPIPDNYERKKKPKRVKDDIYGSKSKTVSDEEVVDRVIPHSNGKEKMSDVENVYKSPTAIELKNVESHVIPDSGDNESVTEKELLEDDNDRHLSEKEERLDKNVENHTGNDEKIFVEVPDEAEAVDDDTHFESVPKGHKFSSRDIASKFLIIRGIPETNTRLLRFINDILSRLVHLEIKVVDIHAKAENRELIIQFRRKDDIIKAIENLHGFEYSGAMLSTVLSDDEYAVKFIAKSDYHFKLSDKHASGTPSRSFSRGL